MKTIRTVLVVATTLSIFFCSCKKGSNGDDEGTFPDPVYFKIGNKWTYDLSGFTFYDKMVQEITANNNGIYTATFTYDSDPADIGYLYASGGYLNSFEPGETKKSNQRYLKYVNTKVGDKWTKVGTTTYNYELIKKDTLITVPAGSFVCDEIKVLSSSSFFEQYNYYNTTVGLIKTDGVVILELASKNF